MESDEPAPSTHERTRGTGLRPPFRARIKDDSLPSFLVGQSLGELVAMWGGYSRTFPADDGGEPYTVSIEEFRDLDPSAMIVVFRSWEGG
jgi:hypothetical protein